MPLLSGSVTFSRFRADLPQGGPSEAKRWLLKALRRQPFQPVEPSSEDGRSAGFVELSDHDATGFAVGDLVHGERALFGFRIDVIRVPSSALKAELGRWSASFEAEHGRPPARREKAEGREAVRQMLRQRTPPSTRVHDVSLDLRSGAVTIWAGSRKAVEEVAAAVEKAFGLTLTARVPAALAAASGLDVERLAPTPELVGSGAATAQVEVADDAA